MSYRNAWVSRTPLRRGRKPGWEKPGIHDPWEYNTIPAADREWMKRNQTDLEREALSRSITGGFEQDNEEG